MGAKSRQVVIVGAGLFGSMAAKLCHEQGYQVTIIDSDKKEAGSKAAACLIKPSWLTMLSKNTIDTGMAFLYRYYGVKKLKFKTDKLISTEVLWVPPKSILNVAPYTLVKEEVVNIGNGKVTTEKRDYTGKVLVAVGVWCDELIGMPRIKELTGASLYFKGRVDPLISIWAPYKQSVMFNIARNTVWFGDGTSILRKNYSQDHIDRAVDRAKKHKLTNPARIVVGRRPAVEGYSAGYFQQIHPNTWVSTGGAKNGTILAAAQAVQFLEAIS